MVNARGVGTLVVAILIPAAELAAQQPIPPGTRVRVTAPELVGKPIAGRIGAIDSATITVRMTGGGVEQIIPFSQVTRLQVHAGRSHSPLQGIKTGVLVGGGVGLLLGVGTAAQGDNYVCEPSSCVIAGTIGGAFWGTIIGGLIGAAIGSDRWEDVAWRRPQLSLIPRAGGLGVMVSFTL